MRRRFRFSMRALLWLPAVTALLMAAIDPFTAKRDYWRIGIFECDVVDAADWRPIVARVTRTYVGILGDQPDLTSSYTTQGDPYDTFRYMTPRIGYGALSLIVHHIPATLLFRRNDLTVVEGIRFRVEADGYEPFEFVPVDSSGKPLAVTTGELPVFRVELRRRGGSGRSPSWSTRPELKFFDQTATRAERESHQRTLETAWQERKGRQASRIGGSDPESRFEEERHRPPTTKTP